jgi:hypothetical protein
MEFFKKSDEGDRRRQLDAVDDDIRSADQTLDALARELQKPGILTGEYNEIRSQYEDLEQYREMLLVKKRQLGR